MNLDMAFTLKRISKMSAFVAEPEASADGWVVSDRKKKPPELRFRGTREECECVAGALNALERDKHENSIHSEDKKRLDHLMHWDRERGERMRVLEERLRALGDGQES
jgi:hypothetical protein